MVVIPRSHVVKSNPQHDPFNCRSGRRSRLHVTRPAEQTAQLLVCHLQDAKERKDCFSS